MIDTLKKYVSGILPKQKALSISNYPKYIQEDFARQVIVGITILIFTIAYFLCFPAYDALFLFVFVNLVYDIIVFHYYYNLTRDRMYLIEGIIISKEIEYAKFYVWHFLHDEELIKTDSVSKIDLVIRSKDAVSDDYIYFTASKGLIPQKQLKRIARSKDNVRISLLVPHNGLDYNYDNANYTNQYHTSLNSYRITNVKVLHVDL